MSERSTTQLPGAWTLVRDIATFLGGWAMIFMEISRPEVRESVLLLAGTFIGIPGFGVAFTSIADAVRRGGTGGSQSQPAEPAGSPSS